MKDGNHVWTKYVKYKLAAIVTDYSVILLTAIPCDAPGMLHVVSQWKINLRLSTRKWQFYFLWFMQAVTAMIYN